MGVVILAFIIGGIVVALTWPALHAWNNRRRPGDPPPRDATIHNLDDLRARKPHTDDPAEHDGKG